MILRSLFLTLVGAFTIIQVTSYGVQKLHFDPDTRTLEEIYEAAKVEMSQSERKTFVIYAGGDFSRQSDTYKTNFQKRFPEIHVELIVDFSKYHDARIDYQLATNSVVFDYVQLQTLQDFPRWKEQGALLNYKPIGWDTLYPQFRDEDGAYTAVIIYAFSNNINTDFFHNDADWPTEALDYLRPEFGNGSLILDYPNDDDAVLFIFKQIVDKYGIDYLRKLQAQNPVWVRGTNKPLEEVAAGRYVATFTSSNSLVPIPGSPVFVFPRKDPFVIWPQTAAIPKNALHPETAKLYMSWLLDLEQQNTGTSYSVRQDVPPPGDNLPLFGHPNGSPLDFLPFMQNRAEVERIKNQCTVVFGEPQGPNPNYAGGVLGTHPIVANP